MIYERNLHGYSNNKLLKLNTVSALQVTTIYIITALQVLFIKSLLDI